MDDLQFETDTIITRFCCVFDPDRECYTINLITIDTKYDEVQHISTPIMEESFISHAEAIAYLECVFKDVKSQYLLNNTYVFES